MIDDLVIHALRWNRRDPERWAWASGDRYEEEADCSCSSPDLPDARAVAEEARTVFERVGARPYLERLTATISDARTVASVAPTVTAGAAAQLA